MILERREIWIQQMRNNGIIPHKLPKKAAGYIGQARRMWGTVIEILNGRYLERIKTHTLTKYDRNRYKCAT